MNFIQYPLVILLENTSLSRIILKFLIFSGSLYFVLNLVSRQAVNVDIWRYFSGDNFLVTSEYVSVVIIISRYRQISFDRNIKSFW